MFFAGSSFGLSGLEILMGIANLGLRSRCSLQPRLSHYGLSALAWAGSTSLQPPLEGLPPPLGSYGGTCRRDVESEVLMR